MMGQSTPRTSFQSERPEVLPEYGEATSLARPPRRNTLRQVSYTMFQGKAQTLGASSLRRRPRWGLARQLFALHQICVYPTLCLAICTSHSDKARSGTSFERQKYPICNLAAWMSSNYHYTWVRRESPSDAVLKTLRERILDRHLAGGERLPIDDLARELEVSPTPIREALSALESEGLVVRIPHRGYSVAATLSATSLDQLYEVRLLLEPHAASLAALGPSALHLSEIRSAAKSMPDAAGETGADPTGRALLTTYAPADRRFHEAIAGDAIDEHNRILQAIEDGLPDEARKAMVTHLERARDRYRPWAKRSEN